VFVNAATEFKTERALSLLNMQTLQMMADETTDPYPVFRQQDLHTSLHYRYKTRQPVLPGEYLRRAGAIALASPILWQALAARAGRESEQILTRVHIPALVVHGEQDNVVKPGFARFIAQALPKAKLVIYEHSGPFPFADVPELFIRELATFGEEAARTRRKARGRGRDSQF